MEEKNRSETRKTTRQSAQNAAGSAPRKRGKKKRSVVGRIFGVLGTLLLVGILTAGIFTAIFMRYVNTSLRGHVEVDVAAYDPRVSSELYYKDPSSGEWVMYDTLFLNAENRIWVELKDIPKHLRDATIAIEDQRFETHKGVDLKGTVRAILSTLTGKDVQGGSSITQQMLKNATHDDQDTVKRKVVEIYRALAFEKEHSKDEILEMYLNLIYMGESCYGVKTASKMYFNKDVSDLTLAESASLIAITNNPSMYDPLLSDWTRTNNRNRQLDVLDKMLELGKISEAVYNAAKNEEIVFSNGYTCFGNYVNVKPEVVEEESGEEAPAASDRARYSYFTDQVIEDVIAAFMEKYGYDEIMAENKVFSGCKIYTTQNIDIQHICEDVFENTSYTEYVDEEGRPLQAAITLMDPYTGEVLGMVGGTGVKTLDRSWNWATATRQCGSSIKPISTYAPALDDGTINMATAIDDYPILMNGSAYPYNASGGFGGMTSVYTALVRSLNTCAVRVNLDYGVTNSYYYMTERLGFTTLDPDVDSQQVGNMALGGLNHGVTTEEMCAAYCSFVNDGLYVRPYTFVRVEDAEGNVLLENKPEASVAMKETTAYLMRDLLSHVVTDGTGSEAWFSGMPVCGKTGTTDDEYDRYFVGFTPYYCAAVWTGYTENETIEISGNPSSNLWRQVMERVHENLEYRDFHDCDGLVWVTVCADSGLLATDACTHDVRGSRTRSVLCAADNVPTRSCNMHRMISYCKDGKHEATEYCPKESVEEVSVLDYNREIINNIKAGDHAYLWKVVSGEWAEPSTDPDYDSKICPVHNKKYAEEKKKEEEEKKKQEEKEQGEDTTPVTPTTPIPVTPTTPVIPITPTTPPKPTEPTPVPVDPTPETESVSPAA